MTNLEQDLYSALQMMAIAMTNGFNTEPRDKNRRMALDEAYAAMAAYKAVESGKPGTKYLDSVY